MRFNKKEKFISGILAFMFLAASAPCFAIVDTPKKNAKPKITKQEKKHTQKIHKNINLELDATKAYNNETASVFSLQDCVNIAVTYNPQIRSSVYNELAYKTKIGQAWANFFPVINLGVEISRSGSSYSNAYMQRYMGSYNTIGYVPNLSGEMMIFDFGKTKATADMAKNTYASMQEQTKENINVIVANIKTTYYNILFAQAQVKVYEDTVADYELQLKQAKGFYTLGKKAKIDVVIAEYNRDKANLNLIKAQNVLKKAKVHLSNIMGIPDYHNYTLSDEMTLNNIDCELENAINIAYKTRPELIAAEKSSVAAKMKLRAQRREFAPNLGIFGGLNYGIGNAYNVTSTQFGAGLNYNALNIAKIKKQIDEANYLYKKSISDYDSVKNDVYNNVKKAYIDVETAKEEIVTARSSLIQAKEQCRQATGRYKAGVSDAIELKDSENTYLNARLDFYNSMLNYNVAVATLEKEIGAPIEYTDKKIIDKL